MRSTDVNIKRVQTMGRMGRDPRCLASLRIDRLESSHHVREG
ncbi:MAG: hypothetical protein QOC90_153 [Mycobacterium sp.]|nr:hypothetical protein [Mycobacterium sp.]